MQNISFPESQCNLLTRMKKLKDTPFQSSRNTPGKPGRQLPDISHVSNKQRKKNQIYSGRFQAPTDNGTDISSTAVTSTNQQWISETCRSLTKETSQLLLVASISFHRTPFKKGKANKPESWHPVLLDLCRLHEPWQNFSYSYPLVLPPSKQGSQGHFGCQKRKIHFDRSRRNK